MKYLLFSLLSLVAIAAHGQTDSIYSFGRGKQNILVEDYSIIPPLPRPSDSIWHLKGTHKKVTRSASAYTVHDNVYKDSLKKWIGPPPDHITWRYDTSDEAFARQLDTIDVWRMVCDTTPGFGHGVKLMGVKEVREFHNSAEGVMDVGFYPSGTYRDYWQHLKYLTQGGRKLAKGMAVIEPGDFLPNQEPEYAVTRDPAPPEDSSHGYSLGSLIYIGSVDTAIFSGQFITITPAESAIPLLSSGTKIEQFIIGTKWMTRRMRKRYERYLKKQQQQP